LTVGSLFAGIGGIDLGLERAGMVVRWQVEIDEWCRRVLAKHWPDVERFGDVRECGKHNLAPVDLICGGFPCQPVSVAGRRKGDIDERWLWPEFIRVVREVGPRWVLAENVPGLLSADAGRLFGTVLRDLAESGYAVEWDCIPAAAVGAPHLRDRAFIVANSDGNELMERAIFGDMERLCALCEWREAEHGFGRILDASGSIRLGEVGAISRMDDGLSTGLDRLRGLGNAVVPQVAEWTGRRIVEVERERLPE